MEGGREGERESCRRKTTVSLELAGKGADAARRASPVEAGKNLNGEVWVAPVSELQGIAGAATYQRRGSSRQVEAARLHGSVPDTGGEAAG